MPRSSGSKKRSHDDEVAGLLGIREKMDMGPRTARKRSRLADVLLNRYFWGEVSAAGVQGIAAAATEDGLDHPTILKLSGVGTDGAHSGGS